MEVYLRSLRQAPASSKAKMLFAFSSDEDVSVDAIHLLKELKCSVVAPTKICDSIL